MRRFLGASPCDVPGLRGFPEEVLLMLHRQAPCGRYRLLGRTAATQLGEEELVLLGLEALKVAQEPG